MTVADAPVLAHVIRDSVVESVHHGLAVVTDARGFVVRAWGDPTTDVFPRSSLKPLQALASLRAGAPLAGESLALACASHSGEQGHLHGVLASLAGSGLHEADLRNTPGTPIGEQASIAWREAGRGPSRLAQNCSGKHAGMLRACVASGWSTEDYLDAGHPLQLLVRDVVEEVAEESIVATATDGCGAPVPAFPLVGLARAHGRLASASTGHQHAVAQAMRDHPWLVAGTGRPDTLLMRDVPGAIAKVGAEGVFAVGLADGRGVAVKCSDGATRGAQAILAGVLRTLGVDVAACERLAHLPVLGHGQPVGSVVAVLDRGR